MRGRLFGSALILGYALAAYAYTPRNHVSVTVDVATSYDPQSALYRYDYTVHNQASSPLEVATILIPLARVAVERVAAPQGWSADYSSRHDLVSFDATEVVLPPDDVDDGTIPPSPFQIKPGQALSGFSIWSPHGPGPIFIHAQGFTQLPVLGIDVEEDTAPGARAPGPLDPSESFRVGTIGPVRGEPGAPIALTYFLHGGPKFANPTSLFLNSVVPTLTTAKYLESGNIRFANGNPWTSLGQWVGSGVLPLGGLTGAGDLHFWLGLRNRTDEGAAFDVKADVLKNGDVVATAITKCVTDVVHQVDPRDASRAKEVILPFAVPQLVGVSPSDSIELHVSARIGTKPDGSICGSSQVVNVRGLRAYFDGPGREARFTLEF